MTSLRIPPAIVLVLVVVLLAAGCAEEQPAGLRGGGILPETMHPATVTIPPAGTSWPLQEKPDKQSAWWIAINPVGDHPVRENFTISGTTNLAPGEEISVDIRSTVPVTRITETIIIPPKVKVREGFSGNNTWSMDIDTTYRKAGEYGVRVFSETRDSYAYQQFNLTKARTTAVSSLVKQGNLKWTAPVTMVKSSPVIKGDIVYFPAYNGVAALDAGTGSLIWNVSGTRYSDILIPTDSQGVLYAGGVDGKVSALDEKTGLEVKTYMTDPVTPYALHILAEKNGMLYVYRADENIYAFDTATGKIIWQFSQPRHHIIHETAISDGTVAFTTSENLVYALDAATGETRWTVPVKKVQTSTEIVNGIVYAGDSALDQSTGSVLWKTRIENPGFGGVLDGTYYTGTFDGKIYALDPKTGSETWKYETGHKNMLWKHSAAGGIAYFENLLNGQTYALDSDTGQLVWTHITKDMIGGDPVISGKMVYVGGEYGYLYALDAKTGTLEWAFSADGSIRFSPAADNETVYFSTDKGIVYAVSPPA